MASLPLLYNSIHATLTLFSRQRVLFLRVCVLQLRLVESGHLRNVGFVCHRCTLWFLVREHCIGAGRERETDIDVEESYQRGQTHSER